jgi:hypothetical protein
MTPGPTTRRKQPPLAPDEKEVLRKKIIKFVAKGYIGPIEDKISSLIKYFAVPKGSINGVVQDWRTVFHVGTNKLNICIWTPSFSLPTVNSFLCIVDHNTLMANQDMGKMFLNFYLHLDTIKFAGIDLAPLKFSKEEWDQRWMCWRHNLMGFKELPYNLVCMYLVAKEVIHDDWNNYTNAFQWSNLMLNLPCTKGCNPLSAWITNVARIECPKG